MAFDPKKLKNGLVLAPMAGVTNAAFRMLCRELGADLCFTEMVHSNAVARGNKSTIGLIDTTQDERPVVIQLFGQKTDEITKAAGFILENRDKFPCDMIDFNIGCPATKIMRQGAGAALLNRPKKVEEILSSLVKACSRSDVPVSCKIRSGITKRKIVALEIAKIAERCGCRAITVHPRAQSQGYEGKSDWNVIKEVKENTDLFVIGNGDVKNGCDAKRMIAETKCDAVMIGRAAMGNPYVFTQIKEHIKTGKDLPRLSLGEQILLLRRYFELLGRYGNFKDEGNRKKIEAMKTASQYFTKGYEKSSEARLKLNTAKTEEDIDEIIGDYLSSKEN